MHTNALQAAVLRRLPWSVCCLDACEASCYAWYGLQCPALAFLCLDDCNHLQGRTMSERPAMCEGVHTCDERLSGAAPRPNGIPEGRQRIGCGCQQHVM